MKQLVRIIHRGINTFLIFLFIGVRSLLGPARCKFTVTCGVFTVQQLREQPLHKALWSILKRVLACSNPFS